MLNSEEFTAKDANVAIIEYGLDTTSLRTLQRDLKTISDTLPEVVAAAEPGMPTVYKYKAGASQAKRKGVQTKSTKKSIKPKAETDVKIADEKAQSMAVEKEKEVKKKVTNSEKKVSNKKPVSKTVLTKDTKIHLKPEIYEQLLEKATDVGIDISNSIKKKKKKNSYRLDCNNFKKSELRALNNIFASI
ncbi:MAG: hypothetical protein Kapaf2KO_12360 [Candidatus Kapaibacteriales bacterium]